MARRDLTGAVDFGYLEDFAAGDSVVIDEVLEPGQEGWPDAVHTIKGAARGVGAFALGEACAWCEAKGEAGLSKVRDALDAALSDVAAYAHEQALKSLKAPR